MMSDKMKLPNAICIINDCASVGVVPSFFSLEKSFSYYRIFKISVK